MSPKLIIAESSEEPMPTVYGGEIETLDANKRIKVFNFDIEEADTNKKLPAVKGGKIKRVIKSGAKVGNGTADERNNPFRVRQKVYELIISITLLVFLLGFLVVVVSSVYRDKLDFQTYIMIIGAFMSGIGLGRNTRPKPPSLKVLTPQQTAPDDEEMEVQKEADDTS